MAKILSARALTYGTPLGRLLQRNLEFQLSSGELLLVTGSNGAGKSTLLRYCLGWESPQSGAVHCSVAKSKIEYLPQLENTEVHLPLTLKDVLTLSGVARSQWHQVQQLGLLTEAQGRSAWNSASGGERKRTMLTRALLRNPQLLVLDEPMNHLDSVSRASMIDALSRFVSGSTPEQPRAVLMVCHQGLGAEERGRFPVVRLDLDGPTRVEQTV